MNAFMSSYTDSVNQMYYGDTMHQSYIFLGKNIQPAYKGIESLSQTLIFLSKHLFNLMVKAVIFQT